MIDDNGDDEKTRLIHGGTSEDYSATIASTGDDEKTRIIGVGPESTGDDEKTKIFRQNKGDEISETQNDNKSKMQ